jgi:hypothetical protein
MEAETAQPVPLTDVSPAAGPVLCEGRISQFGSLRDADTQTSLPGIIRWSSPSGRARLWPGSTNLGGQILLLGAGHESYTSSRTNVRSECAYHWGTDGASFSWMLL